MHLRELLALLADGRFHSGQALGAALGVSRAKVWLSLRVLQSYGVAVEAVKGRGYRLSAPLELLDASVIVARLTPAARAALGDLELFLTLDSSNAYLMQRGAQGLAGGSVCLAEHQSAGKGRRGREWVSPLGCNIYLSLLWRFSEGLTRLGGLSLAIGVAVIDGLKALGVDGLAIKWPNDIVSECGKAGGILLEVAGESNGPCYVVVGIGLNVNMPTSAMSALEQPWANISDHQGRPGRSEVAASLISHVFAALDEFPAGGLEALHGRWTQYDFVRDKEVNIHLHDRIVSGVARGIDRQGSLLVEHNGQIRTYSSGEVSLRLVEPC